MYSTLLLPLVFLPKLLFAAPHPAPASHSVQLRRRVPQAKAQASTGKAIYFLTNDGGNAVVAICINADGTLGESSVTQTGGAGSIAVNAEGQPAVPDALVGQSALTLVGQNIFAVNAASNTISMLSISPNDPLTLNTVGQPAQLPGTFPNTIAASAKNSLVCVGMTGSRAGISCGTFDAQNGIGQMDALRPFDLGQSDPPVGPLNTVSQTFFSQDESMLFTTVKGDPAVNNTGFLSVFPVNAAGNNVQARTPQGKGKGKGKGNGNGQAQAQRKGKNNANANGNANANNGNANAQAKGKGKSKNNANANENANAAPAACDQAMDGAANGPASLSTQEIRSSPDGTAVLFGSLPIPNSQPQKIFATDASFGAAILSVGSDMQASLLANQSISDQVATCWVTISAATNTAFVTDVGVNHIVEMSLEDASILNDIDLSQVQASAGDPGLIDLRAAGNFIYALSPGNGTTQAAISVVDVQSKQLVQHAELGNIGVGPTAMGMAVLL